MGRGIETFIPLGKQLVPRADKAVVELTRRGRTSSYLGIIQWGAEASRNHSRSRIKPVQRVRQGSWERTQV